MSIELEPSELTFQRPFTRVVTQTLRIRNPNFEPVVFKVKTTAPKQYCVRPNSGRIESGKEVEVQVLLQAMKSDPPADYKCRDKFLVQSISITADREATNVQAIWSYVEKTEKSAIRERKIRVVYLPPGEGAGSTHCAASLIDIIRRYFGVATINSTPERACAGWDTSPRRGMRGVSKAKMARAVLFRHNTHTDEHIR